jgi:hypothetical protein
VQVITGEVIQVTDKQVQLSDSTIIRHFEYLVLASGSYYDLPALNIKRGTDVKVINAMDVHSILNGTQATLLANTICIIGAGV